MCSRLSLVKMGKREMTGRQRWEERRICGSDDQVMNVIVIMSGECYMLSEAKCRQ